MSDYLEHIKTKYDIKDHVEPNVIKPKLPDTGIVLIVGTSGSGKTTILKSLDKPAAIQVDNTKSVIENFSTPEQGEQLLLACGLRTIPAWFRPPHTLSNGEFHRFEIALSLDQQHNIIDEFTSVVDRDTAKSLACSVRKYFDSQEEHKVLYIASCHRDIIDWLQPDYVYDTDLKELTLQVLLRRPRPEITVTIKSASKDYWKYFSKYHYLDTAMSTASHCYVGFIGEKPVAFCAVLHSTNRDIHSYWRGHRTVVLPEFQGLGIGAAFSDAIGEIYLSKGLRYFSKTAHPAFGEHREKSPKWRPTSTNKQARSGYLKDGVARKMPGYGGTTTARDAARVCYSHEYIGDGNTKPATTKQDIFNNLFE